MEKIKFVKFVDNAFGKKTALIQQKLTVIREVVSGGKVNNSLQAQVFSAEELGLKKEIREYTETRNYLLQVPINFTAEQIEQKLTNFRLNRILSNNPILTDEEAYMITSGTGTKTILDYAKSQVVRNSQTGSIVLDNNNKFQFRRITLGTLETEDQDLRTTDNVGYSNAELVNEYKASLATQPQA